MPQAVAPPFYVNGRAKNVSVLAAILVRFFFNGSFSNSTCAEFEHYII